MSMMSLYQPLSPRDMARWTLRIYSQYWQQWMLLTLAAVVPLLVISNVLTLFLPQPEIDMTQLDALLEMDPSDISAAEQQALLDDFMEAGTAMLQQIGIEIFLQLVILGVVAGGAGAVMAAAAYRGGTPALGRGLQAALVKHGGPLLGGHLLVVGVLLALIGISAATLVMCIGVLGLGFAIYMYLAWIPLLAPALVLEDGPVLFRVMKAWHAGKKRIWVVFGGVAAVFALRFALSLPLGIVGSVLTNLLSLDPLLMSQIVTVAAELFVLPLSAIFFAVLYLDTRDGDAAEGALADGLESMASGESAPGPFLSTSDLPNVIGVAMLAMGLLFVVYVVTFGALLLLSLFGV